MNNSIRIKSATEYVIEVNELGECISIDPSDTSLNYKLCQLYETIDALSTEYEEKAKKIDARPDEPHKIITTPDGEEKVLFTKNQHDGAELINQIHIELRAAVDALLGTGACQKIFGDKNYIGMFDDLMDALKPHFENMGLTAQAKANAAEKHMPNREQRRTLK